MTTSKPPEPPKLGGNSIRMSISGPVGHVVNSGETIQLYCQAAPTVDLGVRTLEYIDFKKRKVVFISKVVVSLLIKKGLSNLCSGQIS